MTESVIMLPTLTEGAKEEILIGIERDVKSGIDPLAAWFTAIETSRGNMLKVNPLLETLRERIELTQRQQDTIATLRAEIADKDKTIERLKAQIGRGNVPN